MFSITPNISTFMVFAISVDLLTIIKAKSLDQAPALITILSKSNELFSQKILIPLEILFIDVTFLFRKDPLFWRKCSNIFFTTLGNLLFSLKLSDILYTYVLGKTKTFKLLNLKSKDFCLCVEIPISAKRMSFSYVDIPSYERKRIAGKKKVNEFRDGFKILFYMIKRFLGL